MRTTPWLAIAAVALGLTLGACAANVDQAAHSGKDGRYNGARAIALEPVHTSAIGEVSYEAVDRGVVTYPGGDRVDWKRVDLPADKHGNLEIELSWSAPRDGLDLSFDVYNQWGRKLDGARPRHQRRDRGKKSISLTPVKGTVFVEIYASNRGDAGTYKLAVRFDEILEETTGPFDPTQLEVPDPPPLAAVPPPCEAGHFDPAELECLRQPPACTTATYDARNPNCASVCNPQQPDPANPACGIEAPPPPPPPTPCDLTRLPALDRKNASCDAYEVGKVTNAQVVAGQTEITIGVPTGHKVAHGWIGHVLDSRGKPIVGGDFEVRTTRSRSVTARVKLKTDTVQGQQVLLEDPTAVVAPAP
ncbi:MAG: hypothetical protein KC464_06230 [Myxococcales bacterium]|nr:hypothetical protein [Myxococcales bacterium]